MQAETRLSLWADMAFVWGARSLATDMGRAHGAISNRTFPADITVICPWEAFNHLELHELAQYGII